MSTTPEKIAATAGRNTFVYTVDGKSITEYNFILALASKYSATIELYRCEIAEITDVQKKISGQSADVAVIVNSSLRELKKRLDEYDFTSLPPNKYNPKFFAATSN
jgi:hypothetical protein